MGQLHLASDNYAEALGYFMQAGSDTLRPELSDSEFASVCAGLARCCLGLGRLGEAREHAQRQAEVGARAGDPVAVAEAHVILARADGKGGRFRDSLQEAEKAYAVLRTRPDTALMAEASKALGAAHAELGDMTAARDCFMECLVCNRRLGNEEGVAGAYNNLGILAKRVGDLPAAVDYFEQALEIDRRLGKPASVARRLNNLGVAFYRLSRWDEAERHLRRALEIYVGLGATRDVVSVQSALGNVHRVRRDWDTARDYFTSVLHISRKAGYHRAEALALEFLGDLAKDQGRCEEALTLLDEALVCARGLSSSSDVIGEVLRRRAEAYLALGRTEDAERDCRLALSLERRIGDRLEEGATLRVLAAVAYEKGDAEAALVLSARAEESLQRTGQSFELAMTALTDATGIGRSGAVDDDALETVESRLSAAERLFESMGADYWVGVCCLERARALVRSDRPERAGPWLARAAREFESAGDAGGLEGVRAVRRESDAALASAVTSRSGKYSALADASLAFTESGGDPRTLHSFASVVANEVAADRVVLFRVGPDPVPRVVTSFGRTGRRLAEVRRFVRSVSERAGLSGPLVGGDAAEGGTLPSRLAAMALIPASGRQPGETYILYADRLRDDRASSFAGGDIEFLAAAARLVAAAGPRVPSDGEQWLRADSDGCGPRDFVTRDPGMLRIIESAERVSASGIPVLILGESGVGKDVLARFIHRAGGRRGRLVALNAGAVPPHLQESELFGHVRGAFTDANCDREGLIESARDGTLFLDEVGEMNPELQVKLLRFLQSGEYRRVGESTVRTGTARVISASNRDLPAEVEAGRFRRDLYYRLGAFVLEIPPLRERRSDIVPLMTHFLAYYSELEGRRINGFSGDVTDLFQRYDWRGNNVRELENEVRRGVALCAEGGTIGLEHLSPELVAARAAMAGAEPRGGRCSAPAISLKEEVEALEQCRIREALRRNAQSKREAAAELGLSRTGLYTKMRKYGMG